MRAQWSAQQCNGKCRWGYVPSPTTFRISSPWKNIKPPPTSSSSPSPRHPPLPHFHHSPSRCSRILQYKPGTDVGRGLAERPRCSGCQPHAFHSEMKAHSSPSCEANFKKEKKEVEKNKLFKCLHVPSKAVHKWAHLFVSCIMLPASTTTATCLAFFFSLLCKVWTCEWWNWNVMTRWWWEYFFEESSSTVQELYPVHTTDKTKRKLSQF